MSIAALDGTEVCRDLKRGTPQGGILSPLLWNLCFDTFLEMFDKGTDLHRVIVRFLKLRRLWPQLRAIEMDAPFART